MDDQTRRQIEDDAKQAGWDASMLATGKGFKLTNEEAYLVHKLVSDILARTTDKTIAHDIGNESDVSIAMRLYLRLSNAMPSKRP